MTRSEPITLYVECPDCHGDPFGQVVPCGTCGGGYVEADKADLAAAGYVPKAERDALSAENAALRKGLQAVVSASHTKMDGSFATIVRAAESVVNAAKECEDLLKRLYEAYRALERRVWATYPDEPGLRAIADARKPRDPHAEAVDVCRRIVRDDGVGHVVDEYEYAMARRVVEAVDKP